MTEPIDRRDAIKQMSTAGVAALLAPSMLRARGTDFLVDGKSVFVVQPVTPTAVRIQVLSVANGARSAIPDDGALHMASGVRTADADRAVDVSKAIRAGNLVVRFASAPSIIYIETTKGVPVQQLTLEGESPKLSFLLPKGPLLGMGQGGPQFDRKGSVDRMRSGQAGYQLRTHGARVPIQWLVGTDGWA